jgi:hypothetical protein
MEEGYRKDLRHADSYGVYEFRRPQNTAFFSKKWRIHPIYFSTKVQYPKKVVQYS